MVSYSINSAPFSIFCTVGNRVSLDRAQKPLRSQPYSVCRSCMSLTIGERERCAKNFWLSGLPKKDTLPHHPGCREGTVTQ